MHTYVYLLSFISAPFLFLMFLKGNSMYFPWNRLCEDLTHSNDWAVSTELCRDDQYNNVWTTGELVYTNHYRWTELSIYSSICFHFLTLIIPTANFLLLVYLIYFIGSLQSFIQDHLLFILQAMRIVNMVKLKEEFDYESQCRKLENQVDHLTAQFERQQKLLDSNKLELERQLKECQDSFAEAKTNLSTKSQVVVSPRSHL